ncbi:MAG: nicotinate phosphoribosyltransferase [Actinomycetia bacterium]|nr:nicotinate phosphoribosyltransferase [Actinomycetes bacterium]
MTAGPLDFRLHTGWGTTAVTVLDDLDNTADRRRPSTALFTDRYELTMVDAALRSGVAHHRAVFEVFARRLPAARPYGVVAGTGRVLDAIEDFRFDDEVMGALEDQNVLSPQGMDWLGDFRFTGSIYGYAEGELHFAGSPVLTVEASFAEAVLLETVILSILNHDSAVASAAARMVDAALGRPLIEGGSRRTHERAAVSAARAAFIAGFDATSNLEAGRLYDIPTVGTAAHAFVLAHANEADAFTAQRETLGPDSIYLVDTYDVATGVQTALDVVGPKIGGVRIDSGDLADEAFQARALLDQAGATSARIIASGDLDEDRIDALASAPIDGYLAGTEVVTGSGAPTVGLVYKLVAIADSASNTSTLRAVAKQSSGKSDVGGRKFAHRVLDAEGNAVREEVLVRHTWSPTRPAPITSEGRGLQVPFFQQGVRLNHDTAHDARRLCHRARAELSDEARTIQATDPAIPTRPPH